MTIQAKSDFIQLMDGFANIKLITNSTFSWTMRAIMPDAGDWEHVAVTYDFDTDSYQLYVNGVLVTSSSHALDAPTLTDWALAGLNRGDSAIDRFVVFDRVLTAEEIAQLYNLRRPVLIEEDNDDTESK